MHWQLIHEGLVFIQRFISILAIVVILTGVLSALGKYFYYIFSGQASTDNQAINLIRMNLGRTLILGLEFIVAADLIGTTTTPDYYAVGLLAIIVVIRTVLNYSLNRELVLLNKE
ncbi:hypothetical protein AYO45_00120 [Gammaproteobacteria bacterium SCGC AG-212-F23]|nr:hypothetical protein AYO45_00120 [Gammaproteobacteria bacterium SCGC AG-212-F23]